MLGENVDIFTTQNKFCHTITSMNKTKQVIFLFMFDLEETSTCVEKYYFANFVQVIFLFSLNYLLTLSPIVKVEHCLRFYPFGEDYW